MSDEKVLSQLDALRRGLDEPGPALPLSPERERALLDTALATHAPVTVTPSRSRGLALALAFVAVGAAATLGVWHFVDPKPKASPTVAATSVAPPSPEVAEAAPPAPTSAPAPVSLAETEPAPARPTSSRPASSPSVEAPQEIDLLKQANDLRRAGDFAGAEQRYRQVIQRHPQTTSAYVAMSSVASLLMNRDPAAAIEMYRAARRARPSGTLDLEIRQGLARGYRKLGQSAAERRELEELIARYPQVEAAKRAKDRLSELGALR